MATIVESKKACAVNPLKMSQPLGASYAFLGMDACMPVMHGSQGCTSFGLVLLVRHFKEAIPLQTTAMNEVTTILGGLDNIEQALLNIRKRAAPRLIAICSTGLTETKGDDVVGFLELIRKRHPELEDTAVVYVSTPDYVGAFEDGYAHAVTALVQRFVEPFDARVPDQINVLAGSHLTPGDIEELREIIEAFGLRPLMLPDVSGSLDGHIPDDWRGTTLGGTKIDALATAGGSIATLALGEQMRSAAIEIEMRAGVRYQVFDRLTGLEASDRLLQALSELSGGRPVPPKYRRQRSQLQDAMLDAHFYLGGVRVAIGAEPDLLFAVGSLLQELGAELACCVTTTKSPVLERLPAREVLIGDLEDLERGALGCDLIVTHSHGRQAAERLAKPLFRIGIPTFDRIGNSHRVSVGYRGTRNLVFELGNTMLDRIAHHGPDSWPLPQASIDAAGGERMCRILPSSLPLFLEGEGKCRAGNGRRPFPGTLRGDPMKVAFSTQDRQRVDAHFGWARHIAVYDVTPQGYQYVETFDFGGELQEDGDEDKLAPKLAAIRDCAILYVAAIGGSAAARVVAAKIHPIKVAQPEPILDILEKLQEVLKGTPPPWLRKALAKGQQQSFDDEEFPVAAPSSEVSHG